MSTAFITVAAPTVYNRVFMKLVSITDPAHPVIGVQRLERDGQTPRYAPLRKLRLNSIHHTNTDCNERILWSTTNSM